MWEKSRTWRWAQSPSPSSLPGPSHCLCPEPALGLPCGSSLPLVPCWAWGPRAAWRWHWWWRGWWRGEPQNGLWVATVTRPQQYQWGSGRGRCQVSLFLAPRSSFCLTTASTPRATKARQQLQPCLGEKGSPEVALVVILLKLPLARIHASSLSAHPSATPSHIGRFGELVCVCVFVCVWSANPAHDNSPKLPMWPMGPNICPPLK